MAMTWRTGAGPGGLTRKRPGHNVNTYRLTQNKVLSRETMTASGAILIKRGEITCPRNSLVQEMCPAPGVRAN